MKKLGFLLTLFALSTLACAPAEPPAEEAPEPEAEAPAEEVAEEAPATAFAILHDAEGAEVGWAKFVQAGDIVVVTAEVAGLERDGLHGFHVHQVGECLPPDFTSAGGHFNPRETRHSCPPEPVRHAGDFGNFEVIGGRGVVEAESDLITVVPGETSVVDRAVIVHRGTDDCVTQPTGDAGSRYACGVIRPGEPEAMEDEAMEDEGEDDEGEDDVEDAG